MLTGFNSESFLSRTFTNKITDLRVKDPVFSLRAAKSRIRRSSLSGDGKLNLLAADHPARNVTKIGSNPLAMADRHELLARILRVLISSNVDGIMATMDILEDLFTIEGLLKQNSLASILDNKILVASLNRGGLAGTCWELDDPMTGATVKSCALFGLDGAKVLLRLDEKDPASLRTLSATAIVVNECNSVDLPMFLEPLPVITSESGVTVIKTPMALAKIVGVASAIGDSSRNMWLKLPYCEGYSTVARSTTLPILILGGESVGDPKPFLGQLVDAMCAGPNVRGALVGRNVLFPESEDPFAIASAVGGIIHQGWTLEKAVASMSEFRDQSMDRFSRLN